MQVFDAAAASAWIGASADAIGGAQERLSDLDAAIGDGDHGRNMDRGFSAAREAVAAREAGTPGEVLVAAGTALISKVGGAAGPLFGSLFRTAGKNLDGAEPDAAALAAALRAGQDAVQRMGAARVGDKTLVDALDPAVAALESAAGLPAASRAAADAAVRGAEATIPLHARKGRASYLGERSIGHEDPGAASTALLFTALADTLKA